MPPPDELSSSDLITVALDLLEAAEHRGHPTHLRRALSTAYYAMFHCLARVAADRVIRAPRPPRERAAWLHVYRSLQHQHARKQCLNNRVIGSHPDSTRRFAARFAGLQEQRHTADYSPVAKFEAAAVRRTVETAAEAIDRFEAAREADQAAFAAWVLLATRKS